MTTHTTADQSSPSNQPIDPGTVTSPAVTGFAGRVELPADLALTVTSALLAGFNPHDVVSIDALDAFYGHLPVGDTDIDFATLYARPLCQSSDQDRLDEDFFCEGDCCLYLPTPTQAWSMFCAASVLLETAFMEDWSDETRMERLPPICATYNQDPQWWVQLAHAIYVTRARLAAGQWLAPNSTAEEMVLHLILDDAPEMEALLYEDVPFVELLPWFSEDDRTHTYEDLREVLFEDHDVLMLFDARLDGIENSDLGEAMGMVSLHPRDWFHHFRSPVPALKQVS
jgi:hypothetical protein